MAVALASCHSTSYRIQGTVEGMQDGDTLFLTTDMMTGIPHDTIIVREGRFSYEGETDSVQLGMLYSAARNEMNIPFFLEPGNISVSLSETPGSSRVSGTKINSEWQRLNDSVMVIGKEINRIAEHIYGKNLSQEEQQKGMEHIDRLNKRFSGIVVDAIKRNVDNEFGYFLLTYYPEELIDNQTRQQLIGQLPDKLRNRDAIKQIERAITAAESTGEGATITDFSQPTLDGTTLSLMSEVSQHQITIIDFWASWCGPCRQEMPFMTDLYARYQDRGLGIIGISLDENKEAWQQATQALNIPWPQMSDLKGWENSVAKHFNITSIPHTIVVDHQGKILRRGLRGSELESFVAEQLQ